MIKLFRKLSALVLMFVISCTSAPKFTENISYSNLKDEKTRLELKDAMVASGIDNDTVNEFLKTVDGYNKKVGDVGLVEKGFVKTTNMNPNYDEIKIQQNWEKNHKDYDDSLGNMNNCRITTFSLTNRLIEIDDKVKEENRMLFFDLDVIENKKSDLFNGKNLNKFISLFGEVKTPLTKDINVHLKNIQNYWKSKNITFKPAKAKIITVWFHNELDNNLFVGHTGVLIPSKDGFYFIEKISFDDPYQVFKFKNKYELNDYLMAKYDVSYNQKTSSPIILENFELLKEYRKNPKNVNN